MRRYTALFQIIGQFEVFTNDSRYVYDFSYLSSATSYDRAEAEARRAIAKRVRLNIPSATGFQILGGSNTCPVTIITTEDRLYTVGRMRTPARSTPTTKEG